MSCLNEAQIQAVADDEATESHREHVRGCSICSARVSEARAAVKQFAQALSQLPVPPALGWRVRTATPAADGRAGATTLRAQLPAARRPAWLFAGAAAAAAVLAWLFIVFPSVDPGTNLRAAEILDRSLQALTRHGVERLEYELTIETSGQAPLDARSALTSGADQYRIDQLIDHDTGRWRLARFAPDGTLLNGIAENPATGTREAVLRLDGRTFRFEFAIEDADRVALWNEQRRYAESMIRLVQASGAHVVREETVADERRYVVELPDAGRDAASPLFDLQHARVVVDANDYHIVEFAAGGAALGEELSIRYRLIQRIVGASLEPASAFALVGADDEVIERRGKGTRDIPGDMLSLLLRELGRSPAPQ
jgi:hypothetical protein